MFSPRQVDPYVGVPYLDRGRDPAGWDCWGCLRWLMMKFTPLELAKYETVRARQGARIAKAVAGEIASGEWLQVMSFGKIPSDEDLACAKSVMRPFDVVTMRSHYLTGDGWQGGDTHVGLAVSSSLVIHVERVTDTVCFPITHASISFRLREIYRHRSLA